jgi:alkylhydroperoxidase family enzyme
LPEDTKAFTVSNAMKERKPLNWERAMAQLPGTSLQIATLNAVITDENLGLRLKSELLLISAINNRAWYSTAHSLHRLQKLGVTENEIAALVANNSDGKRSDNPAHRFAAKLTVEPQLITDADIASIRKQFSDAETAQIVHVICIANLFDRFTESLGLPLEVGIDW